MTPRPSYVSVIDPVGPALERVRTVLFRPFDLGRWFVIGFCAWLAQLGQAGGGGGGGDGGPGGTRWRADDIPGEIHRALDQAKDFLINNLHWLVPVTAVVLIIVVGVWLLVLWLNSRGRFMFLYCVAQNKAQVVYPWHQFRRHGNSLFGFRIALGLTALVISSLFLAAIGVITYAAATSVGFNFATIAGIACCAVLLAGSIIVFAVVGKLTKDFAVPIMYRHAPSSLAAWRVLLDMLALNKGRFFLYLVFQIVISVATFTLIIAAGCLTCCCACCLFLIPYIGTVTFLPIHVFTRSYSLYYLAQYGPEFNVVAPEPPVAPPPGAMPT